MPDNIDSLQIEISANASKAEKSLNKLASSLGKIQSALSGIDSGRFQNLSSGILQLSNSMERFSSSVKTADFTRIATGLNKLSSVNVQGVSDASRAINTLTANLGNLGTIAFDSQGIANIANSVAQLGRKTVTQAADNIPKLTSSLGGLVSGLSGISSSSIDVSGLSQLTSSITKLGGKSATAAAGGNIDKLAESLKKMMTTLSTSPRVSQNLIQMTQALAQLASTGSKAGAATVNLSRSFGTLPTAANKAKTSFNGLASAIGKFYATYWLLIRALGSFKKAIDISSDLTEVQNVVDVSFGSMSDKMNEFADSALELYGMSELTAKQIGSRFQAMGVSMGFAQEDMTDMSIRLTQLAGDLASFYNITQDEAATKLQSIFTGESEPLRSLGIDLAQTSVEAWALSQGIDADMRSMTNAEKTMLRYQYVLASTGQATNDFQRTSDTWANSLRRLTGSFEQLGSIVGGVLINAFKPFVQALNSVMQAVISFAQVVSDALGAIFGWKYQTGGGVAQDLEMGAAAAEDIENATGGAADNAKKLKSYTLGIDELNILNPDDGSGSGSGGGGAGGAGGGAGASGGEWVQTESLWEKYTSSIGSLYELGKYIGDTLSETLRGINWDEVYKGAENFGTGLASFLNGLFEDGELFGELGTTIANSLNTVLHGLDSFAEEFDWTDFGKSLANGINNFFKNFDFGLLAETLNDWVDGLEEAILEALKELDWQEIFESAWEFFTGLELDTLLIIIGAIALKAKRGSLKELISSKISDLIRGGIELARVTIAIGSLDAISLPGLQVIGNEIVDKIDDFIRENFGQSALNAMGESLLLAVTTGAGALAGPIGAAIGLAIGIALDTFIVKGEHITKFWDNFKEIMFNFDFANSLLEKSKNFFETAFNSDNFLEFGANIVAGIASGLTSGFFFLTEPIADLFSYIVEGICDIFGIHSPAEEMKPYGEYILKGIAEGFKSAIESWTETLSTFATDTIDFVKELFGIKDYSTVFYDFGLDTIVGFITGVDENYSDTESPINTWVSSILSWFNGDGKKVNNSTFLGFAGDIISGFNNGIDLNFGQTELPISTWVSEILSWFNGKEEDGKINATTFAKFAAEIIQGFKEKIGSDYESTKSNIETWAEKIKEWFWGDSSQNEDTGLGAKFKDFGKWIMTGLKNGLESMWETVKGLIRDIADSINDLMEKEEEIGSPSKRFFRYGVWMMEGLENGLNNGAKPMMNSLSAIAQNIPIQLEPINGNVSANSTIPSYGFSTSSFAIPSISAQEQNYTGDEMLVRALETVLDTRLIPIIQSASTSRDELLQTIADKDTNTYIDGRKVNRILNNQQSRSGYSIRK